MSKRLKDRVVCVTGAGRGLGRAIAQAFAAEGASLVLGARSTGEIDELASELPDAIAVQTDVRLVADVDRLVEAAVAEFGRLDVMVNNAGVAVYGPLENMGPDEVHLMVDTNLKGTIFGSQAALRVMAPQRGGLIVNISSIAGKLHLPNEAVYGATKWAVNGFSGVLRLEAQKHGVRVSCVCPGGIDTPFWKSQEFLPFPENIDPERDFLRPEDVAQAVLGLALGPERVVVPELVVLPMLP
jgi:NADP-dependent 3-hydroxy acid dehydrogenase YdfG